MTDFKLKQIVIDCSHPATIQQALSRFDEYANHLKNGPDESQIVVLDSLSMLLWKQKQYPYTQIGMNIAIKQLKQHKSHHNSGYVGTFVDLEHNQLTRINP